jgi:hypothetical protein
LTTTRATRRSKTRASIPSTGTPTNQYLLLNRRKNHSLQGLAQRKHERSDFFLHACKSLNDAMMTPWRRQQIETEVPQYQLNFQLKLKRLRMHPDMQMLPV